MKRALGRKAIGVALACLVALSCGGNTGEVLVVNQATEPIAQAVVKVCGQTIELRDIAPGADAAGAYRVTCDGSYDIAVQFASRRSLMKEAGLVARGLDFRHRIVVTDKRIEVAGREVPAEKR